MSREEVREKESARMIGPAAEEMNIQPVVACRDFVNAAEKHRILDEAAGAAIASVLFLGNYRAIAEACRKTVMRIVGRL